MLDEELAKKELKSRKTVEAIAAEKSLNFEQAEIQAFYQTVMKHYGYVKVYLVTTCLLASILQGVLGDKYINSTILCTVSTIQSIHLDNEVNSRHVFQRSKFGTPFPTIAINVSFFLTVNYATIFFSRLIFN